MGALDVKTPFTGRPRTELRNDRPSVTVIRAHSRIVPEQTLSPLAMSIVHLTAGLESSCFNFAQFPTEPIISRAL
jgi:hypothetical protein